MRQVALPRLRGPGGRPLKVAHLTTVDMSLSLLLATELSLDVEAGLDTYGISAPGPFVRDVEELGVTHVPLPSLTRSWDLGRDRKAAGELLAALRRLGPDVLHTHNPKTGVLGRTLGRLARIPVVVNTCHGLWASPDDPLKRRLPVYAAEVAAAAFSHAELYQNETDRQTLRRFVRQRTTEVVGNGTDLDRFAPDPDARAQVRAELGLSPDHVLVGCVGRRVAEKGVREFAEVARRLAGRGVFAWIGPDDPDKRDAWTGELEGVHLLGERRDMAAVYNALDIFVLPSYREGFSRSAMEAAACGTAMVLSDIRGCRELGESERHLLLVPAKDADALTGTVARLIDDPDLRQRLAERSLTRARTSFDQRQVGVRSLTTYAAVAHRRGLNWTMEAR